MQFHHNDSTENLFSVVTVKNPNYEGRYVIFSNNKKKKFRLHKFIVINLTQSPNYHKITTELKVSSKNC